MHESSLGRKLVLDETNRQGGLANGYVNVKMHQYVYIEESAKGAVENKENG